MEAPTFFRRQGKFISLLPLVWLLIGLLFAAQLVLFDQMPVSVALTLAAFDWLPWILLSPLILSLGRRFEFTSKTWGKQLFIHCVACTLLTLSLELQFNFAMQLLGPPPPPHFARFSEDQAMPPLPEQRGGGPSLLRTPRARMTIPLYWVLVAVAHALVYHKRSLEREGRALRAEAGLTQARLALLQSQLNPHFLFNTLNTMAQFVHEDARACERMIEGLASLLRSSLGASTRQLIPLSEELALVDSYLDIQTARFPDRLLVVREVDPRVLVRVIPPLLVQPLVENAILHGLSPQAKKGLLTLRLKAVGSAGYCIEVIDTGDGSGGGRAGEALNPAREGVGLRSVRERLRSLYGEAAEFSLTWHTAGGVCSRVTVSGAAQPRPSEM